MSNLEKGGGRTWDHGAPAGYEGNGWDRFDEQDSASRSTSKAPSFEFRPSELEGYRETGCELIRLHAPDALDGRGRKIGKAPRKGWRAAEPMTIDQAAECIGRRVNVGVRLRPTDLVVDIDPRNIAEGDDPVRRLQADLGFKLHDYPHVLTGSGGSHYYMTIPDGLKVLDTLPEYSGIEFKAYGRQVVAAGSAHPDGPAYIWDDLSVSLVDTPKAPERLIRLIRRPERQASADGGEISPEQLTQMLDGLDPCDFAEHGKWFQILAASHHATAGEGRDEFIEWSTRDPSYSDHADLIGRRWDSLHADASGSRITIGTLRKFLIDARREDLIPRADAEDDFAGIADEDRPEFGEAQPKSPEQLGLTDEWVWIAEIERFVRRSDTKKFSRDQFKSMYQSRWPGGDICNAVWKGELPIPKVESLAYVPSQPQIIPNGEWAGRYNLWRPSGVKAKPGDVSVFLDHMAYLIPDETERGHVMDYLSLLVAEPFVKVHFALLVQGKQGTGKSFLGALLRKMIGERNVSMPGSTEVAKEYTGWQEGVQLAVLEEMMALGRREIANRLKPVITDDYLRIRHLYMNPYSTPNFLNLLCFTNHDDALPIEAGDRRWLVVFSEAEPKDEAYYTRLFGLLDGDGPAAVKHFLQQRRIGLNPKGVAPSTTGKAEMRRLSLSEAEQHLAELLEEGSAPFDFDLVRLEDLIEAVPAEIRRQTKGLRHRLTKWMRDEAGAREHTRYTKRDGSNRPPFRLWTIRNHDEWAEAGAAARIDAFCAHTKLI